MATTSRGFFTGGIGFAAWVEVDCTGCGGVAVPVPQPASAITGPAVITVTMNRVLIAAAREVARGSSAPPSGALAGTLPVSQAGHHH
jgi:hypothetical protein